MKKNFDFVGFRKISLIISLSLFALCIVLSLVMGVEMDISFKGGTLAKYSYTGTLEEGAVTDFIESKLGKDDVIVDLTTSGGKTIISISKTDVLSPEDQEALTEALKAQYPNNKIVAEQVNAVQPSMGRSFFAKCLLAVGLAALFLILYVAYRFRKIGGFSAGLMAVFALVNDLAFAYLAFIIFQIPLNDNFVAVMLTILGYSLNDTIVIFDRIRENRAKMSKEPIHDVVNLSLNQSLGRAISTSLSTIVAMTCVAVVAAVMNLDSIISFAIPMLFGLVSGSYTSLFLCPPVWSLWMEKKAKKGNK